MLSELERILTDGTIESVFRKPHTDWNSVDVTYEDPHVERLWLPLGENRLNLHCIHPCKKPLIHPHPWPSAVKILTGKYLMGVGTMGSNDPTATMVLREGSSYEMLDPIGWHYVQPLDGCSFSVMLTGRPWPANGIKHPGRGKNEPLSEYRKSTLWGIFRGLLT